MVPAELLLVAKEEKCHKNSRAGFPCLASATSQDQASFLASVSPFQGILH